MYVLYVTDTTDYNFTPLNITIPAGNTSATFNVIILHPNNIVEDNETFCLFIDKIFPSKCSLFKFNADPLTAKVIIVDEGM